MFFSLLELMGESADPSISIHHNHVKTATHVIIVEDIISQNHYLLWQESHGASDHD
jgi:hypothetical protein